MDRNSENILQTSKIDSPCASTVNLVATMALHPYPKISKDIKCKDVYYDS